MTVDTTIPAAPPQPPAVGASGGYLLWCPCMGRFGNQVDGLLGALRVGKSLNRTIVVPPFIEYDRGKRTYRPFDEYFDLASLGEYHRSISMENFVAAARFTHHDHDGGSGSGVIDLAAVGSKWTAACHESIFDDGSCEMRRGQPSTGFWDHFRVDFDESVSYDSFSSPTSNVEAFGDLFPPDRYPVVALSDVPGRFPVLDLDRDLQRYVRFRDEVLEEIHDALGGMDKPVLAVHVRNGGDWEKGCRSAVGRTKFMESPQCLDEGTTDGLNHVITQKMCLPGRDDALDAIRSRVQHTGARTVYVGFDFPPLWLNELRDSLNVLGIRVVTTTTFFVGEATYLKDLAVFGTADYFLGNCISSFTGFAARYRSVRGFESGFFGVGIEDDRGKRPNEEDMNEEDNELGLVVPICLANALACLLALLLFYSAAWNRGGLCRRPISLGRKSAERRR